MKAAVIVFPGSNCDRDMKVALEQAGAEVSMVWHKDANLPAHVDLVAVPGGFSFGDYLRCGAIAAQSPVCQAVVDHAQKGGYVLGVCNGFQVLTETGLLPGALMRNAGIKFIGKTIGIRVETSNSDFTNGYNSGDTLQIPVAHHDGNYFAQDDVLKTLQDQDRVAFRYETAINGSQDDIAGILSENRRVLGMMPHPERAVDPLHPSTDGQAMFRALVDGLVSA